MRSINFTYWNTNCFSRKKVSNLIQEGNAHYGSIDIGKEQITLGKLSNNLESKSCVICRLQVILTIWNCLMLIGVYKCNNWWFCTRSKKYISFFNTWSQVWEGITYLILFQWYSQHTNKNHVNSSIFSKRFWLSPSNQNSQNKIFTCLTTFVYKHVSWVYNIAFVKYEVGNNGFNFKWNL